ncbi:flagellin [Mesorhizobium sp. Cs1299R1N1]|uniref:flagellin N-terminal helical domain-containing protein n=1 Tax=unclassified Mesorhizobium TaxID=325217 RepID=UPI00301E5391
MSSIMTNSAALTALQSLNTTSKSLEQTQARISTGYRVATASDNAAYWSIATTMRSDNKANSVVQDALGLGAGKVDTAYTAMNKAIDVVDQIKQKVLLAKSASPADRAKIQSEIASYQAQLTDNVGGANYAGSNLLQTDSAATTTKLSVISSYNRSSAGAVTTGTIDVTLANVRLIDLNATPAGILDTKTAGTTGAIKPSVSVLTLDVTTAGLDDKDFNDLLTNVETALGKMSTGAAGLGAAKSRIDMQTSFISSLSDSIDKGVGTLVDADMNKESTRLQALQVQQQLGIQALSIANGSSQQILSLFRG